MSTSSKKRKIQCEEGDDTDFNATLRRRTALNIQPDMLNLSRGEWEKVFFHYLSEPIKQYIKSLYASAMKKGSEGVEIFVENMVKVSEWTPNELAYVIGKLKLNKDIDFQELLKFILMSKGLLLTYPSQSLNESYSIDIEVPKFSKYIHSVFTEIAEKIMTQPYIASHDASDDVTYFQKDKKLTNIISDSLTNALMHSVPCDKFLQKNVKGLMQYTNFEAKKMNSIVPVDPAYEASKKVKTKKKKNKKPKQLPSTFAANPVNNSQIPIQQPMQQQMQQPIQQQHPFDMQQQQQQQQQLNNNNNNNNNQAGFRTMGLNTKKTSESESENSDSSGSESENEYSENEESENSESDENESD